MKTKKITKKLNLNKKTVADLNNGELMNAHGGILVTAINSNCILCTHTCGYTCLNTCVSCDPTGNPLCKCNQ